MISDNLDPYYPPGTKVVNQLTSEEQNQIYIKQLFKILNCENFYEPHPTAKMSSMLEIKQNNTGSKIPSILPMGFKDCNQASYRNFKARATRADKYF